MLCLTLGGSQGLMATDCIEHSAWGIQNQKSLYRSMVILYTDGY